MEVRSGGDITEAVSLNMGGMRLRAGLSSRYVSQTDRPSQGIEGEETGPEGTSLPRGPVPIGSGMLKTAEKGLTRYCRNTTLSNAGLSHASTTALVQKSVDLCPVFLDDADSDARDGEQFGGAECLCSKVDQPFARSFRSRQLSNT